MLQNALEFLLRHGYIVLLVWVFAEQVGLPVPSVPLLLAAGALAGSGQLNPLACVLLCVCAAVLADSTWYSLGRFKGMKILRLICKVSLEPDSCVRRAEGAFAKRGARSLLVAKFVPGLGTVAPPLAGVFLMRWERFLLFDIFGACLWAGTYLGLGFVFSGEIERVAESVLRFGSGLITLIVAGLASYITYKFTARRRFLRELRIARITVDELKQKIDAGEELVIVDLRHSLDFEADPDTIPGAFHLDASDLEKETDRLPRDREIILYCT
jgi:membrane protein DedA with SNARE-associated domain